MVFCMIAAKIWPHHVAQNHMADGWCPLWLSRVLVRTRLANILYITITWKLR